MKIQTSVARKYDLCLLNATKQLNERFTVKNAELILKRALPTIAGPGNGLDVCGEKIGNTH